MMIETIGVPIAFAIFSSMSLWIIIGCKGNWLIKSGFILATTLFSICLWDSLDGLSGWPTKTDLPKEFEIKWIIAKEPNLRTGKSGGIYVWAIDLHPEETNEDNIDLSGIRVGVPRVHKVPYSRKLHMQALEIQKMIAKGKRFFARYGEKGVKGGNCQHCKGTGKAKGGKGKGKCTHCKGTGGRSLSNKTEPQFHKLPPAILPDKVTGDPRQPELPTLDLTPPVHP